MHRVWSFAALLPLYPVVVGMEFDMDFVVAIAGMEREESAQASHMW